MFFKKEEKINKDNSDVVVNQVNNDNNSSESLSEKSKKIVSDLSENFNKIKNNNIFKICLYVFLLIFLLLSLARIPYVGVFLDAVLFSFIFGYAKYLMYLYLITILVMLIINKKVNIFFSKRFALAIVLSTFFLSILFSGIQLLNVLANNEPLNLITEYIKYWKDYIFNFNINFLFGQPNYLDGGIIGTLVGATSGFFLIIFSIIAIIVIFLLLFKSWRNIVFQKSRQIKNKLDKKIKKTETQQSGPIQEQFDFIGATVDSDTKQINADSVSYDNYFRSLLKDDKSIKNNQKIITNKKTIDDEYITSQISMFLKANDFNIKDTKINHSEHVEYIIFVDKNQIEKFKSLTSQLQGYLNEYQFSIQYLDDAISIIVNDTSTKFSNHFYKILQTKIEKPINFCFALNEQYNPIILDLIKNNSISVYSNNQENIYSIINSVIASIAWNYSNKNFQIFYLSEQRKEFNILKIGMVNKTSVTGINEVLSFLKKLDDYCQDILEKLKQHHVNDIYELNDSLSNIKPNRIILIDDINILINQSMDVINYLNRIIEVSNKCGISIIFFDYSTNYVSYDKIKANTYVVFKCNSSISNMVFNSNVATNLGDLYNGILYNQKNNKLMPFSCSKISELEIDELVKILKRTMDEYQI